MTEPLVGYTSLIGSEDPVTVKNICGCGQGCGLVRGVTSVCTSGEPNVPAFLIMGNDRLEDSSVTRWASASAKNVTTPNGWPF